MALKAVLTAEDFEAADESVQSHYSAAADGRYYLEADGVDELPTVRGLAATLKKYRDVAPDANVLRKRIEEATAIREAVGDLSLDEVKEALARLKELEDAAQNPQTKDKDAQAEIQRVKDALEKQRQKDRAASEGLIAEKEAEIARLMRHVESKEIDLAIEAGLGKVGVMPEMKDAVRALLKERGPKVVWDGDAPKGVFATDLDDVPILTYIEAWGRSDEAKPFLPASGNEGTGSKNGAPVKGGRVNPWKDETRNITKQGEILRENPALAQQLASAAGKRLMVT